jgi:hypothetical protein
MEKNNNDGGVLVVKNKDLELHVHHVAEVEGSELISSQGNSGVPLTDEVVVAYTMQDHVQLEQGFEKDDTSVMELQMVREESSQAELGVLKHERVSKISNKQMMSDTRFSSRLQEKNIEKI